MKRFEDPVLVTRPYLPDLAEFHRGCEEIWANQWLTNNGPLLQRFHEELAKCLDVATSHALSRIGAKPVFADIDPETLCLSPAAVGKLIKPGVTRAIVPVHVYGNACDVEGFSRLGEKYGLKIIYDAAHAFGTDLHRHGDMSMFSLHPTKLFHSCEGGLLVFKDSSIQQRIFDLRNFATRERIYSELKDKCNVFARRYFYPLLTDFAPYAYAKGSCPVAEDAARRVLTLPTYYGLDLDVVKQIAESVMEMV